MRRLIINADDFGFSEHTVEWTKRCFDAGVLSSATIMAGACAVKQATQFARANRQWSFGLHLVLSDEVPLSPLRAIPSLVSPQGRLWPTRIFMLRSALGLVRHCDLEREIRAQMTLILDEGIEISHVDGHGHMHRMPFVVKTLIRLKKELGLERLRPAQDLYYNAPLIPLGKWLNRGVNRSLRRHFSAPDHFLMTAGRVTREQSHWFGVMLERLPEGCTEIGVHPGTDEEWRRLDTEYLLRQGKAVLGQAGCRLISYHDIRTPRVSRDKDRKPEVISPADFRA